MKLRDIITEGAAGDFVSGFKQGFSKEAPAKGSIAKHFKKSSPYDIVHPQDMKMIIDAVLNKKPLDPQQEAVLQKLYKRL